MLGRIVLALTFVGGGVGFALAYVAWSRSGVPGSTSYSVHMTVQGLWALSLGAVLVSSSPSLMRLFQGFATVFSVSAAFLWLVFVLEYTGRTAWLRPRRLALLWAQPVAYFLLFATNPLHGFVYAGIEIEHSLGLSYAVTVGYWPLYAQILVIYLVLFLAFLLLGTFLLRSRSPYRKQPATIFAGGLVVVAGNLVWVVDVAPSSIDLTPLFFVGNGVVVGWALFRYDFLNVTPLAANTLVEEMDDPIVVVDDDRRLIDYNECASAVFGLDDTALGSGVDGRIADVLEAAHAGRPVRVDGGSGTPRARQAIYQPNRTRLSDHHDVVRGELVVLRDITTQKRREEYLEALQAGTRDLMEAETRAEVAAVTTAKATSILDYPFAGVLLYDDEREELVSASLSGPTRDALEGSTMRIDSGVVWETFQDGVSRTFDRADLEQGPYSYLSLERVLLYPLGDHGILGVGTERRTAFSDDDLRFAEILALTAEASLDRAEREERLEERRIELQARNEHLNEFANIVSHDLRNPLNSAEGYLELARTEPGEEYFDAVERAHDRMSQLIEDILTLARQGEDVVDPSPVALGRVARAAWETAGSDRGRLVVDDGTIEADEKRLRTILENLFRNACHHGNETATVTVRLRPDDGRFSVEDDGTGIDADVQDRIFEYGYTTETGGTGFGLSIVDRIATAHGWTVSVEDGADGGARFVFDGVRIVGRDDAESKVNRSA